MNRTVDPKPRSKEIVTVSVASLATTGLPTKRLSPTIKLPTSANVLKILIIIKPECGRNPVNPEQATVYPDEAPTEPRWSPGKSRQRSGKAPVYRNSAETRRGYPGNRPRQSYGNAP
ncbi:hypothetical protein DPMN_086446, partial [Dreissena polymorpha]